MSAAIAVESTRGPVRLPNSLLGYWVRVPRRTNPRRFSFHYVIDEFAGGFLRVVKGPGYTYLSRTSYITERRLVTHFKRHRPITLDERP